jgi:P27 family predicted phage terminase small subunit
VRGRPRKPHRLRALEGGRGHSRPLATDLAAPKDPLVVPAGLSRAERAAWRVHVAHLRRLKLESAVDAGQVEALVRFYCRARQADAILARRGLTTTTKHLGAIRRPEVAISRESWALYCALADKFGLSATSRAKLGAVLAPPPQAGDVPPELRDVSRPEPA